MGGRRRPSGSGSEHSSDYEDETSSDEQAFGPPAQAQDGRRLVPACCVLFTLLLAKLCEKLSSFGIDQLLMKVIAKFLHRGLHRRLAAQPFRWLTSCDLPLRLRSSHDAQRAAAAVEEGRRRLREFEYATLEYAEYDFGERIAFSFTTRSSYLWRWAANHPLGDPSDSWITPSMHLSYAG